MRVYRRYPGTQKWGVVTTDANGFNDDVYITVLVQTLRLNLGEDPFFANYGIPAAQSVQSQIAPDFNVNFIQQQFAKYFASLSISRAIVINAKGIPTPQYTINVLTHYGAQIAPIVVS